MTLNVWFSRLHLPRVGTAGSCHHTYSMRCWASNPMYARQAPAARLQLPDGLQGITLAGREELREHIETRVPRGTSLTGEESSFWWWWFQWKVSPIESLGFEHLVCSWWHSLGKWLSLANRSMSLGALCYGRRWVLSVSHSYCHSQCLLSWLPVTMDS